MSEQETSAVAFKLGDVVHLKSGGATMTVTEIRAAADSDYHHPVLVRSHWLTADGYVQLADFPPEALVVYRVEDESVKVNAAYLQEGLAAGMVDSARADDWRKSRGL